MKLTSFILSQELCLEYNCGRCTLFSFGNALLFYESFHGSQEKNRSGLHREKQTQMIFLVQALKFYDCCSSMEQQRARSGHVWAAVDNYREDHNFIFLYQLLWTHIHTIKFFRIYKNLSFPKLKGKVIVDRMDHLHYIDLISANTPNPHTRLSLPVSHVLFRSCWMKALCLPSINKAPVQFSWGFHVSPNTEGLGQKISPPERSHLCPHPFSCSGHEQTTCFHRPGNPFLFKLADHWNLYTQWIRVLDGRPNTLSWIERDKRF